LFITILVERGGEEHFRPPPLIVFWVIISEKN